MAVAARAASFLGRPVLVDLVIVDVV